MKSRTWFRNVSFPAWLALVAAVVVWGGPAGAAVPNRIAYQGYLVDLNGQPLAADAPRNYDVEFRIFDSQSGGEARWAERQTLTIDNGHFSVLLGNGVPLEGSGTSFLEVLSGLDAENRYIQVSVSFAAEADFMALTPRMRLLPVPNVFVADAARGIVGSDGALVVDQEAETFMVDAALEVGSVTANRISGAAAELLDLHANNLASGTLSLSRIPDLNTSQFTGTVPPARLPSSGVSSAKITSGIFSTARIPALDATRISGTLHADRLPSIPASSLSDRFSADRIPNLNVSRISGVLPVSRGGTGRSSFEANHMVMGNGSWGLYTDWRLRVTTDGSKNVLSAYSPGGHIQSFPSDWTGGLATWDIVSEDWRGSTSRKRSDARLKTNVISLAERDVVTALRGLEPVSFEWRDDVKETGRQFGFIAQQVETILPELVAATDNEERLLSVRYRDVSALLVRALQVQQEAIEEGDRRLAERRRQIKDLQMHRDNLVRALKAEGDSQ